MAKRKMVDKFMGDGATIGILWSEMTWGPGKRLHVLSSSLHCMDIIFIIILITTITNKPPKYQHSKLSGDIS